jgi:desulfoferrodoxin-like iron-binding protein
VRARLFPKQTAETKKVNRYARAYFIKENRGEKMTKVGEIYFCEICGNKVKVLEAGKGTLVCCGKPMKLVKSSARS